MESDDSVSNDSFKSGQESSPKSSSRETSPSVQSTKNDDIINSNENRLDSRCSEKSKTSIRENDNSNERESLNLNHEDLSDVSDLESGQLFEENKMKVEMKDLREKLEERKNYIQSMEKSNGFNSAEEKKTDEDVLDFEAEEGECNDTKDEINLTKDDSDKKIELSDPEEGEELEEGELSDEDGKRPEETEPKPVCRFYTRGQCTWGMSCRFLHPGVTDKGNYTMFDMVRPVPVAAQPPFSAPSFNDFRDPRPPIYGLPSHHHTSYAVSQQARPAVSSNNNAGESAWERGLRTAKEMMRKANKRKEQDIDFEDKKMNLSLTQEELEKDNYYTRDRASNEMSPGYIRSALHSPTRTVSRGPPYDEDSYSRTHRYREMPSHHRMHRFEEDEKRKSRPTREVIVQKADQWNDPWMRSKSPSSREVRNTKRDRRSYSSNSSYSSSSSTHSESSSNSSPSPSKRHRYVRHRSRDSNRHIKTSKKKVRASSPSPNHHYSPGKRFEKRGMSPIVTSDKKYGRGVLPKTKISPNIHKSGISVSAKKRGRSTSSNSGSSESSSESDSSYSSSSSGSSDNSTKNVRSRDKVLSERKMAIKKVEMSKKRPSPSNEGSKISFSTKKSNRREELLKQLKAVEDAIARKRSKIN